MSQQSLQRLEHAEQAAMTARARLRETLDEIQDKLSPANIVNETARSLREKGLQMTDQAVMSLRSRPVLATALASGAGWLLSRKPALAFLLRLFLPMGATSRAPKHSIGSRPQRPRRRRNTRPAGAPKETA